MVPLLVALLGALGSIARYGVSTALSKVVSPDTPAGTFVVNLVGSLLIGAVTAWFHAKGQLETPTRVVLTAGFLGGFTTYSSFAYETWVLTDRGLIGRALLNVGATIVACFIACAGASMLVRHMLRG